MKDFHIGTSCSYSLNAFKVKIQNITLNVKQGFNMSEKFNLKWNDFHTNASKAFGIFRNESFLQDVILVSEDFKHIPAHKLVLSACSEYFKRLFQETKQSQPLICLDGVSSTDLKNVLDYVYEGEVKILQEDLDQFCKCCTKVEARRSHGR